MSNWYRSMPKGQKIFLYLVSLALVPVMVGLVPLALLIYLELGAKPSK